MSITTANVITKTRKFMGDDVDPYAQKDAAYLPSVNRAQRRLKQDRPDLLLASDGTLSTYTDSTATTDTLIWGDDYLDALAHYTAYDMLLDDTHSRSNREEAEYRLGKYQNEIS